MEATPGSGSTLVAEVRRFFETLEPRAGSVVVAVSGGPDSSALLHVLATLPDRPFTISAAHVNHGLRGSEADADARWVQSFSEALELPITVLDGRLDADEVQRLGVEAAAREVRYRLLDTERKRLGADVVVTGHTRSDQAETVLLRLLTGRGAWRLSGIRPVTDDRVARPLLGVSRSEITRYLADLGIEARADASNDDRRFLRNRIRHELLPLIESWNPRIEEMLAETARLEQERSKAFDELVTPLRERLVEEGSSWAVIRTTGDAPPHVLRSLLLQQIRRLDPASRETDAASLSAILQSSPGDTRTFSRGLRATRADGSVRLERLVPVDEPRPYCRPIAPGETVGVPEAGVSITLSAPMAGAGLTSGDRLRQLIQLPTEGESAFEIRNRRPGDRFRPLGMDRDKNLADFLIDRRIPVEERDSLPLLVCNDSIAWIAGVEVSDAFKVRPDSEGQRLEVVAERIGGGR